MTFFPQYFHHLFLSPDKIIIDKYRWYFGKVNTIVIFNLWNGKKFRQSLNSLKKSFVLECFSGLILSSKKKHSITTCCIYQLCSFCYQLSIETRRKILANLKAFPQLGCCLGSELLVSFFCTNLSP